MMEQDYSDQQLSNSYSTGTESANQRDSLDYESAVSADMAFGKLEQYNQLAATASTVVSNISDMYADCMRMEAQTEQVRLWSKTEITRTIAKYKSCQEFMCHAFGERDKALSKHYDLLDKAIASNDKDLIIASLKGIGGIVTKSPLEELEELAKLYDDESQPLLDF